MKITRYRLAGFATLLAIGCRGAKTSPSGNEPAPAAPEAREASAPVSGTPRDALAAADPAAPSAGAARQDEAVRLLEQERERLRLRSERATTLAAQYIDQGKAAFERADFE